MVRMRQKPIDNFALALESIPYQNKYYISVTAIEDPFTTLRFVGCGSKKKSKTAFLKQAFSELLAPFDVSTWLTNYSITFCNDNFVITKARTWPPRWKLYFTFESSFGTR